MSTRVVVIGSGVAGLAAAYAARRAKANVTMVLGRPGASTLFSGAIDGGAWERGLPFELSEDERAFLDAFRIWSISDAPALVATLSGRLRPARGRDRNLLDLSAFRDTTIALPRASRPEWDADGLARMLSGDPMAMERGLRFEAIDAEILRYADETKLPTWDLASRHDEDRLGWLVERLREARLEGKGALLFGPWLGLDASAASTLSSALGLAVGETLSPVGGVAGLRFEGARDRLLAALDIVTQPGRVVRVEGQGEHAIVELAGEAMLDANKVVLAIGGVAGGGLTLSSSALEGLDDDARSRAPIFTASVSNPAAVAAFGRPLTLASSPYGPSFEAFAWSASRGRSLLEAAGLYVASDGCALKAGGERIDWLSVAGDAIADRERAVLAALRSGILAGRRAAGEGSTSARR